MRMQWKRQGGPILEGRRLARTTEQCNRKHLTVISPPASKIVAWARATRLAAMEAALYPPNANRVTLPRPTD